jgi:ABC-2 type transport system ATP-binding protein
MNVIEANGISKNYGKVAALKNFSLTIEEGECFALLGKNGAGKTTFVKSLLGLVNFNQGELKLLGKDVSDKSSRLNVSYLPEKFSFYPYYTLGGVCEFYAKLKGVESSAIKPQVGAALERLGISDLMNKKVRECSKGQLQRTGLAATLIGDAKLFILDEPYSGLDPIAIKELQDLLSSLAKEGKTIFINSHGLDSVEKVCENIAILDKGELVVQGNMKSLVGEKSLLDFFYEKVGQ